MRPQWALDSGFLVEIDDSAKPLLTDWLANHDEPGYCVIINRVAKVGDVTRGPDGKAVWSIEQPHPWEITFGVKEGKPDLEFFWIDGFKFFMPFFVRPEERGVRICSRDGRLHVEALPSSLSQG
jgi:hypothetical protein